MSNSSKVIMSNTTSESEGEDSPRTAAASSLAAVCKTCSWCKAYRPLAPNKTYCQSCSEKMFRECSRCHQPYPESKYFENGNRRCNSCQKKYLKEKEKRLQKQQQVIVQEQRRQPATLPSSAVKPRAAFKRPANVLGDDDESDLEDDEKLLVMSGKQRLVLNRGKKNNVIFIV